MAVRAFTFIRAKTGCVSEALSEVRSIREVKSAHICTGGYDIVADIRAKSVPDLEKAILEKIRKQSQFIENSVTFFAFRHMPMNEFEPKEFPILAYVLISCTEPPTFIAKEVGKIDGVKEAIPVLGPFDVIAKVAVEQFPKLKDIIVKGIHEIPGVERTETFPIL